MMEMFLPAAPVILVFLGATIGVLIDALVPRLQRSLVQVCWTLIVLLAALCWTIVDWTSGAVDFAVEGALAVDQPAWMTWAMLLVFAAMATLLFAERRVGGGASPFAASVATVPSSSGERDAIAARQEHSEVFPLLLFSVCGMMSFVAANDLLVMFVSLEILSFPLYILCGMARRRRLLSQESSIKYFMLGAISSAFFLYGSALLYGYSGSFKMRFIDAAVVSNAQSDWLLIAGVGLVVVGVMFKLGAAPFHNWVPDVYQGAPTPVTGFMAVCTKIAAALGLLRLLYVALGSLRWDWQLVVAVIAVLTMVVGSVIGLTQRDVKRLLAYSSIAHAGFILVAVAGALTLFSGLAEGSVGSTEAVLFYLLAYGLATMGAFAIVTLVRRSGSEATSFDAWKGLGRRNPLLGIIMTIFLLSMAGIPLTGGFVGKLLVFMAGWRGGYAWLVLLAVVFSLVTAAFYFRVIWVMFGYEPSEDTAVVAPGAGTNIVIWVGVIGTVLLGIVPMGVIDLVASSTGFVR